MTHRKTDNTLRSRAAQATLTIRCLLLGHKDVTAPKVCRCTPDCRYCLRCGRTEHVTGDTGRR